MSGFREPETPPDPILTAPFKIRGTCASNFLGETRLSRNGKPICKTPDEFTEIYEERRRKFAKVSTVLRTKSLPEKPTTKTPVADELGSSMVESTNPGLDICATKNSNEKEIEEPEKRRGPPSFQDFSGESGLFVNIPQTSEHESDEDLSDTVVVPDKTEELNNPFCKDFQANGSGLNEGMLQESGSQQGEEIWSEKESNCSAISLNITKKPLSSR